MPPRVQTANRSSSSSAREAPGPRAPPARPRCAAPARRRQPQLLGLRRRALDGRPASSRDRFPARPQDLRRSQHPTSERAALILLPVRPTRVRLASRRPGQRGQGLLRERAQVRTRRGEAQPRPRPRHAAPRTRTTHARRTLRHRYRPLGYDRGHEAPLRTRTTHARRTLRHRYRPFSEAASTARAVPERRCASRPTPRRAGRGRRLRAGRRPCPCAPR